MNIIHKVTWLPWTEDLNFDPNVIIVIAWNKGRQEIAVFDQNNNKWGYWSNGVLVDIGSHWDYCIIESPKERK